MIQTTCAHCNSKTHSPEINDDSAIAPKVRLGQLIQFRDEQFKNVTFRVIALSGMTMTLEKI